MSSLAKPPPPTVSIKGHLATKSSGILVLLIISNDNYKYKNYYLKLLLQETVN